MEKMEPGSDNEPDLSVRTSVTKHSLRFNIINHEMKNWKCYNPYNPYIWNNLWLP